MIMAGDFKKGTTFEKDGNVFSVIDFQHVKPGKGSAFVRTKLKNVMTGQVIEITFSPTDKVKSAVVEYKEMQYLYNEGDLYYFMDMETFDQVPFNKVQVKEALSFITENMMAKIKFFKGQAFSVEPPMFVELDIIKCDPAVQGDTARAGNKSATVETGYTLQVPLFVQKGERIRIDTRTGEYMERVSK